MKDNTINQIAELLEKSIVGILTEEEHQRLEVWRKASLANEALYQRLHDKEYLRKEYLKRQRVDVARPLNDMKRRIAEELQPSVERKPRRVSGLRRWMQMAAAVVLIALLGGAGYYIINNVYNNPTVAEMTNDIHPGETLAYLTNSSGEQIELHANAEAETATAERVKPATGETETATPEKETPQLNYLDIPRGAEFQITLEDSTVVWLNSESQLVYPDAFGVEERRVKVIGEAYFKVAKDEKKPFYVETGEQVVRVYGTEFNVRSYPEEYTIETTLVEGSIALARKDNPQNNILLTPGRQVQLNKETQEATVRPVQTDVVTSWRKGKFVFENQTLEQIMRDLARWYDFDYEFADRKAADTLFMGSVPRYADFNTVLTILEKSGGLRFDVNGTWVRISTQKHSND